MSNPMTSVPFSEKYLDIMYPTYPEDPVVSIFIVYRKFAFAI